MCLLQTLLLWAISSCSPLSLISSTIQSFHLILDLPLLRVPLTSISITSLATCCSSFLLIRWPYHLNLASWTFHDTSVAFSDPLTCSFFALSILVTPHIQLASPSQPFQVFFLLFSSVVLLLVHTSLPGLTTALCTLPSNLVVLFYRKSYLILSSNYSNHIGYSNWLPFPSPLLHPSAKVLKSIHALDIHSFQSDCILLILIHIRCHIQGAPGLNVTC